MFDPEKIYRKFGILSIKDQIKIVKDNVAAAISFKLGREHSAEAIAKCDELTLDKQEFCELLRELNESQEDYEIVGKVTSFNTATREDSNERRIANIIFGTYGRKQVLNTKTTTRNQLEILDRDMKTVQETLQMQTGKLSALQETLDRLVVGDGPATTTMRTSRVPTANKQGASPARRKPRNSKSHLI
jgi:hypothetical protein